MVEDYKSHYGYWYWCVKTANGVSGDNDIYVNADVVDVTENGDLVFWRVDENGNKYHQNLAVSKGNWIAFYVASVIDGSAVAVSHWKGEYIND